jgi:hypothetical protein
MKNDDLLVLCLNTPYGSFAYKHYPDPSGWLDVANGANHPQTCPAHPRLLKDCNIPWHALMDLCDAHRRLIKPSVRAELEKRAGVGSLAPEA